MGGGGPDMPPFARIRPPSSKVSVICDQIGLLLEHERVIAKHLFHRLTVSLISHTLLSMLDFVTDLMCSYRKKWN